jgi:fumarate hydratase class II
MPEQSYRIERDSLGEMKVPAGVLWGAQTQRAVGNFSISGWTFPERFIRTLAMVKMTSARVNVELKMLPKRIGGAIAAAAAEIFNGKWIDQFVVDVFQTGSGTSTNMNANEVIARRASAIYKARTGGLISVHPNDHVNLGQSSNDVIPSCIHVAARMELELHLVPALERLTEALRSKSREMAGIVKIGRTHLQDAVPVTLGQEFSGYAKMMEKGIRRIHNTYPHLAELALGGTAVGTGLNAHPEFSRRVIARISRLTGMEFREARNHFEAQGAVDSIVEVSSALKTLAVSLIKIGNDIRWLASGPRCGIGELELPAVQPGSSIMPGKVNPVIIEALLQVSVQVIGFDASVSLAGSMGNFELNTMIPLLAYDLLESIRILGNALTLFSEKCVRGLKSDRRKCRELVEKSLALVTALVPRLGYDEAAKIADRARTEGKTVREIMTRLGVMDERELDELMDPGKMIHPVVRNNRSGRKHPKTKSSPLP